VAFAALLLLAALCLGQPPSSAGRPPATFSLDKDREQIVSLDGQWRFHPGDNPRWASPDFDDSQWPLINSTKGWSKQGYKNMSGLAWYRTRIEISVGGQPLALYIPHIFTSCQVFADGEMIGEFGGMPPQERAYGGPPQTFRLPDRITGRAHALLIAIRVWHWPVWAEYYGGGLQGGIYIGQSDLISEHRAMREDQSEQRSISQIILAVLYIIAGLTAVALFAFRPREKEFVWFGAALLVAAGWICFNISTAFHPVSVTVRDRVYFLTGAAVELLTLGFYFYLLRAKRSWLLWFAIGGIVAYVFIQNWVYATWPIGVAALNILVNLLSLPFTVWIDLLVIRRAIQGYPDARLVMVPQLFTDVWYTTLGAIGIVFQMGWSQKDIPDVDHVWGQPFPISISEIMQLFFLLAMLAILIRRFTRTSRQEDRLATEMESARQVQAQLVPIDFPRLSGFQIEAAYLPAAEVGGDFYQVLEQCDGSLLIVIGDVCGKGLKAAMTGVLAIGAVRALASHRFDPGWLLTRLNREIARSQNGGFITCVCACISRDGAIVFANAGHPQPYRNGEEIQLNSSLPLGITPNVEYAETCVQLASGDRLTFISDGVVEARGNADGFFGFDRVRAISEQSAQAIANAAQQFGQEDDITVLTLLFTHPDGVPA
jgi:hypothetical protein